jgi:hypothetical protein
LLADATSSRWQVRQQCLIAGPTTSRRWGRDCNHWLARQQVGSGLDNGARLLAQQQIGSGLDNTACPLVQ